MSKFIKMSQGLENKALGLRRCIYRPFKPRKAGRVGPTAALLLTWGVSNFQLHFKHIWLIKSAKIIYSFMLRPS